MKHFCAATIIIMILANAAFSQVEIYKQVRISYPDETTLLKILHLGIEPVYAQAGEYMDFAINGQDLPAFDNLAIPYTIIHDDLTAFYQSRNPLGLTMGGYRTFSEMVAVMDSFAITYPNFCSPKFSIATTEQGRSLWVMKVSDNPAVDEDEPEAFVSALIHAREPIGGEIVLEFMRFLFTQYGIDPVATNLVNNYQLYFLPVINADGYEYNRQIAPGGGGMWRKNRRNNWDGSYGVDLNRNFSHFWGYDDIGSSPGPNDETYRGPAYASEPEAMGLQNFVNAHDFAIVVNYHAYGDLFLYPWGYYNGVNDDYTYYDTLAAYSESIGYSVGTPWQLLYNTNGDISDWSYGENRAHQICFGEVIEVGTSGDGFWPPQNRIAPLINENKNLLKDLLPRSLDAYKRRLPQIPTVTSPSMAVPGSQFYVHWQRSAVDTFNLATSYRVTMLADYSRTYQVFESTSGYSLDGFTRSGAYSHSGAYSVYSGQGNNLRNYVTLNDRVKVQQGDNLTFWARYNIQNGYDYAYVQASSDGGVTWWELDGSLSTSEDPHRHNKGFGITGSSGGNWVMGDYPLRNFVGREVKIRFAYWTDPGTSNEGIYIDDVYPSDLFGTTTVLAENVSAESLLVGPYPLGQRWFEVEGRDDRGHVGPPSDRYLVDILGNVYNLTGYVALSDSPVDLSGSIVNIPAIGLGDTTDSSGEYGISLIPQGTYDIIAMHAGYYPDTAYAVMIGADTSFDFALALAPPVAPALLLPLDNATVDTEYLAFDWSDVPGVNRYVLEIAGDADFTNIIQFDSSLTISSYYNSQPFSNGSYYWRVTAHTGGGYSPRSASWRFTVIVFAGIPAPSLVSPGDGFISHYAIVNFDWTEVADTITYLFELSTNRQFTQIVIVDSSIAVSSFTNTIQLNNLEYFWRVRATDGVHWSPYSDIWSVIIDVNTIFLPGDANNTGALNGLDVVFIVNYLKGVGPSPSPYLAGDANGTCNVNGLDVVYLVNFFKGGPYPFRGNCLVQP